MKSENKYVVVFLLVLLQLAVIFLVPYKIIASLVILAIDMVFFWEWITIRRKLQLTNQKKIFEASKLAEQSLSYVSSSMPVGVIAWDKEATITWMNETIRRQLEGFTPTEEHQLIEELMKLHENKKTVYKLDDKIYRFYMDESKRIVYFIDVTEQVDLTEKERSQQAVVGILSVDNYDEAIDKLDDKEVSYINSFITTLISDWMDKYRIYYKRFNAERFYFFCRQEDLDRMIEDKFDLLEKIKNEAEENDIPITVSMGISYGSQSLEKIGDVAQNNLDTALVRGGDQVVVKEARENAKSNYYGGSSTSAPKRTRVRSRAMSTALSRIFDHTGDVYIMGHRYPDMDAIGSAFGVACLGQFHYKNVYVIINENETIPDVDRCLEEIHKVPELDRMLISPTAAMEQMVSTDLLVMVDYHRPSLSISQDLYEKFENIVIIDHHRRGEEFPTKPLLTYIESSASSASELVAELIQFESNQKKQLPKMIATLLLAGITVDTKNFAVRTTSRTFDVASYLKTCGADASLVQYLLSTDITSYLEISQLVGESEYVTDDIVIAAGSERKEYDSVTTAKTADTLLSMVDINAAFVITKRTDGMIGISARSTGTVNVQRVMEAMGGGGHFTNAAVQLKDVTIDEAKQQLLAIIKEQLEGDEDK